MNNQNISSTRYAGFIRFFEPPEPRHGRTDAHARRDIINYATDDISRHGL